MSEAEMNNYRLTSMEEPGDERMAQIMREVAEDARESVWLPVLRRPRLKLVSVLKKP